MQVRKINRWRDPLSSALLPALKEKAPSQGWTQNLGHSARLRVNMWHRSPATCEDRLAVRRPARRRTADAKEFTAGI